MKKTDLNKKIPNNKPWYKKRATIIASSSILGAGVLVAAIATPLILLMPISSAINPDDNKPPVTPNPPPIVIPTIKSTVDLLNVGSNKSNRMNVWNSYLTYLKTPSTISRNDSILNKTVRSDAFINEFINLLIDNLNVTSKGTEIGAITQSNANAIKNTLLNATNKDIFKNITLTTYTNLFEFTSTPMFNFKNSASSPTIDISLIMPMANLDLFYNDDGTISIKIPTNNTGIKLVINKFINPNFTSKEIYFKGKDVYFPKSIMENFISHFEKIIKQEVVDRNKIKSDFNKIKNEIDLDKTNVKGLSYWNSFTMNNASANMDFITTDLQKDINSSFIFSFLKNNAKDVSGLPIDDRLLDFIKKFASINSPSTTLPKNFVLNTMPLVATPAHNNLLFKIFMHEGNLGKPLISLELDITGFNFDFSVDNLFAKPNPVTLMPNLTLSGNLIYFNNVDTKYSIDKASYNFDGLVDSATIDGGLLGFLNGLINEPNTSTNLLTNSLVALNSKNVDEQISFWNTFNNNASSKAQMIQELKNKNNLFNFMWSGVDWANKFGIGQFPYFTNEFFTNFKEKISNITVANLNFTTNDLVPGITVSDVMTTPNNSGNPLTVTVTFYFGYEKDSIKNINFVSSNLGDSNLSFSQELGSDETFTDSTSVKLAASKRNSIVFESTVGTHVLYLGQWLETATNPTPEKPTMQVSKPIIISSAILTPATGLIDAIKTIK